MSLVNFYGCVEAKLLDIMNQLFQRRPGRTGTLIDMFSVNCGKIDKQTSRKIVKVDIGGKNSIVIN